MKRKSAAVEERTARAPDSKTNTLRDASDAALKLPPENARPQAMPQAGLHCDKKAHMAASPLTGPGRANATESGGTTHERTTRNIEEDPPTLTHRSREPPTAHRSPIFVALCALSAALAARTLPGMGRANATASGGITRERTTRHTAKDPLTPAHHSREPPIAHMSPFAAALCALGGMATRQPSYLLLFMPSSGVRRPITWEPGFVEEAGGLFATSERRDP